MRLDFISLKNFARCGAAAGALAISTAAIAQLPRKQLAIPPPPIQRPQKPLPTLPPLKSTRKKSSTKARPPSKPATSKQPSPVSMI